MAFSPSPQRYSRCVARLQYIEADVEQRLGSDPSRVVEGFMPVSLAQSVSTNGLRASIWACMMDEL